jgi:hypothetical protein
VCAILVLHFGFGNELTRAQVRKRNATTLLGQPLTYRKERKVGAKIREELFREELCGQF